MRLNIDPGNCYERTSMRIAIVRLSALGDIIQSMVVIQYIRKHFPKSKIDWVVDKKFSEIVKLNNLIDNVLEVRLNEFKKSKNIFHLIKHFSNLRRAPKYDLVIDTQGLIKSAIISRLIPSLKTVGFDRKSVREPFASFFYSETYFVPYETNVIERYCLLISRALDIQISKKSIRNKDTIFPTEQNKIKINKKPRIAIVVGASFESKVYPIEKYQILTDNLDAKFLCIWGSQQELHLANEFAKNNQNVTVSQKTSLKDLVKIIRNSDLVIGGDTGPTHLSWALNIPSITLFGPTSGLRNMFETDINLKIESDSKVNIKKINKEDFSISNIDSKTILFKSKKLLKPFIEKYL